MTTSRRRWFPLIALGMSSRVALLNVLVKRSPDQVWDFLSQGHRYAEWVVGTREIR